MMPILVLDSSPQYLLMAFMALVMCPIAQAADPTPGPAPLPGRGLAQHDFLYTGEFDTRKPVQTMSLIRSGKVIWTYTIPTKDQNNNLSEFSDMHDKDWKEIWSCDAPSVWDAYRLKNGNTMISGNQHAFVREINPKGEIVWEVKDSDLPGIKINSVHQTQRLANGNTVICNWTAGVKKPDWPSIIQLIEVTPEKKVVWAIREWTEPDLGPASCIQMLDEAGAEENGELQRWVSPKHILAAAFLPGLPRELARAC